ncbi:error-prone DNA polymerase [Cryobacterium mesophilum]|uniref:Error-prone DNA polymerase n=1 Tax=Terrimesophilobacter mesophilus TaxID=433647 RepID=A0A4R8V6Z6_9MICO|nr:error-prone DNA polymerase [Terrimesophilobacter mesophilus]MBB5631977.1 error-prone DNA polymerase [Terrimesophilobacter mesophilus]TFB78874.1 error-prone DNA polymerase [Terrimesophilobacter mesophilus]
MGFKNPPIPWSEFEKTLSDGRRPGTAPPVGADGGDSPAWSRKRAPYRPAVVAPPTGAVVPYAELHAHSNFSFLDGASSPEELTEEASRLGLHGLAITDHDGFYGVVRMAEAAEEFPQLATVFGAELSLGLAAPQNGVADPHGSHLLVLARGQDGYHRLSGAITAAQLAGAEKGRPLYDLDDLAKRAGGQWLILSGCRKGRVRQALVAEGQPAASRELERLTGLFGRDNVVVELHHHGSPLDDAHNDAMAAIAARQGLPVIATGNVHYATPERHRLATALAAVRARRSLDDLDGWLPASGAAYLRSGAEMAARFARYPGAIERTVEYADDLSFRLRSMKPGLPRQEVPPGHTPMSWLRHLVWEAVPAKYPHASAEDRDRIERELAVIEQKDFPGYFLIVHDIVREARRRGILCQGRGSAANSAVCYLLNITAVDSIYYKLPFERFLSSLREEEPDIDVDFDSDRREEIIQHVYRKYGRHNAAQVANVISYRPKVAVRDMAKALGHSPGQQDAYSKQVERWGALVESGDHDIPEPVIELAQQVLTFPRHLGIHSGGMVLTDRPVGEVVPIEHGRMDGRTVVQWDKDDCAWMGLVKFDLLGLGMLAALQYCFDLVRENLGEPWELSTIPREEAGVYDMLCRADSIGVFQVESRAQMGLLPRLQPRRFYDLVVEIAMIRPGPIQGGAVHPYVRRKLGREKVTYAHPKLVEPLERTLGIPVFQEQLMQMAMAVGNCTGEDADLLRRAMGSKRGIERIEKLREKLYAGMAENGLSPEVSDDIYGKIQAFANFGFAESHSLSFALLVYASSWLKLHYPAAFLASLLRAQPMGFYSPASLVADARRHGVEVRRPDVLHSGAQAGLEPLGLEQLGRDTPAPRDGCLAFDQPPVGAFDRAAAFSTDDHRRDARVAVRLGLAEVKGIGEAVATRIVAERDAHGPYRDQADLVRRVGLTSPQLESLAAAGAFEGFGLAMREAIWMAGSAAQDRAEFLEGTLVTVQPPLFRMPTGAETLMADLWATGISTDDHPIRHLRPLLEERGALTASQLAVAESGRRIEVGGVVTHRQRPATASGITFMNLEDESGLVNVICSAGVWKRYRRVARESSAMVVRGILERSPEGVTNLLADRLKPLLLAARTSSRDFR